MSVAAAAAPATLERRRPWRDRLRVSLLFVGVGALANGLGLSLVGAVPFLLGNMAYAALALRLGIAWAIPAALVLTFWVGDARWMLLAVAEAILLAKFHRWNDPLWRSWLKVWLPLSPLAVWLAQPSGGDAVLWGLGISVVLVGGMVNLAGARIIARISRRRRQLDRQPLADQLGGQLSTLMATPFALLIVAALQWSIRATLDERADRLDSAMSLLQAQLQDELARQQSVIAWLGMQGGGNLAVAHAANPGFLTLLRTDQRGDIIEFSAPGQVGNPLSRNVADRHYFREPMASGMPYVSPVFRGRGFGDDLIVAISAPWLRADGSRGGVVQGSLSLSALVAAERRRMVFDGFEYVVLDNEWRVIISNLDDLPSLDVAGEASVAAPSANPPMVAPWAQGSTLAINHPATHLLARRFLPDPGWHLVLLRPLEPLLWSLELRSLIAALCCLVMTLSLRQVAEQFAARFAAPLRQLVDRVRALDLANPATLRPVRVEAGSAELAELVEDFNHAALRLSDLHSQLSRSLETQGRLNRDLEQRVHERTVDLQRAVAKAEHAASAKASFLANMSHELRTPLAAILGHTDQALQNGTPASTWLDTLVTVSRNGRHLLEIVNDVLDASKIESGQLRVEKSPMAPWPAVRDAVHMLYDRAADKGLVLTVEARWPLPAVVLADPLRVKQVVLNLVSNAVKFTSQGSVTVDVQADANLGLWCVGVRDTGIGMTDEQRQRLFQRFEQADVSTTRRFGGSGLGLFISNELAKQMGGHFQVESEPGEGTTFRLWLPIGVEPDWLDAEPVEDRAATPATTPVPRLRGRVLVTDDVDDLRRLVASLVRATGATALEAANGQEAMVMALDQPFDLILMDMHMPVMDGREATVRLREAGYRGPIIALTADVLSDDVQRYKVAGCDEVLAKPVDRTRLYGVMTSALRSAPIGDRHGEQAAPVAVTPAPTAAIEPPVEDDPEAEMAALMAQLRDSFLQTLRSETASLHALVDAGDTSGLKAALHRLKGSAGTFGFAQIAAAAAAAETALKADESMALHSVVEPVLAAIEQESAGA